MRRVTLAFLCLVCLAVSPRAWAVDYTITRLSMPALQPTPSSWTIWAYGPNNDGYSAGTVLPSNRQYMPVLWSPDGSVRVLDTYGVARGINSQRQIVGDAIGGDRIWNPDGSLTLLAGGKPCGINDLGQVVGRRESGTPGQDIPCIWYPDGSRLDLNIVLWGEAPAINNRGQICGGHYESGLPNNAFIWTPGEGFRMLAVPPGWIGITATDMNDSGVVVGYGTDASHVSCIITWNPDGSVRSSFRCSGSMPVWINNAGVIVHREDGVYWPDQLPVVLPGLFPEAAGVNDRDQIVGTIVEKGVRVPVLWTPVPEPSSLTLLFFGLSGLGLRLRRRR